MNDDTTEDIDLEQVERDTRTGDHADLEAVDDQFEDDLFEAVQDRNETGAQRSVSIWNGNIAALLDALEDNPERAEQLVEKAGNQYDISVDELDRSEVVRVLIISGLAAVDPELKESWTGAIGKHASQI